MIAICRRTADFAALVVVPSRAGRTAAFSVGANLSAGTRHCFTRIFRSATAFAVGFLTVRTRIPARRVVRARNASAGRCAERIARVAGLFFAITAALAVGNQRSDTAASVVGVVLDAVAARTIVRFVLTRGAS